MTPLRIVRARRSMDMGRWASVVLMSDQRHRCCTSRETALGRRTVWTWSRLIAASVIPRSVWQV